MNRSDFYYRQIVTEGEMDQAFDDVEAAIQNVFKDQQTYGVVSGFVVEDTSPPSPTMSVKVSAGVAYDGSGDRIELAGNTTLDLTSHVPSTPGESVYVAINARHTRDLQDPRLDGYSNSIDYRQLDDIVLSVKAGTASVTPTKPASVSGDVYLAMVLLTQGMSFVQDSDISMDPSGIDRFLGGVNVRVDEDIQHTLVWSSGALLTDDQYAIDTNGKSVRTGSGDFWTEGGDVDVDGGDVITKGGDILLATSPGSGGDIYLQDGNIYRAEKIHAQDPHYSSDGYRYIESSGDEVGTLKDIEKALSYDAYAMLAENNGGSDQNPWSLTLSVNQWFLSSVFASSGDVSPNSLVHGWQVDMDTGSSAGYSYGLICPLTGLPDRCKLDSIKFRVYLASANGAFDKLYAWVIRVQNRAISFLSDETTPDPIIDGSATAGDKYPVLDITQNDIIDTGAYTYYVVVRAWESGTLGGGVSWFVSGMNANYLIREASHVY